MAPIAAIVITINILGIYYHIMVELVDDMKLAISIGNGANILLAGNPYFDTRNRFVGLAV